MPAPLDLAVIVTLAVLWPAWEHFVMWPRFLARLGRGATAARIGAYWQAVATQWLLSLAALAAWVRQGHAWAPLRLWSAVPWRVAIGAVIVAGLGWLFAQQVALIRRSPKARAKVRKSLGLAEPFVPRAREEMAPFMVLSLTAGICEEWLFRGVLTALLAGWLGVWVAVVLANVVFGLAHSYQGGAGMVKVGIGGLVASGIVFATGSLVPAMVVHALMDVGAGWSTYLALSAVDPAG